MREEAYLMRTRLIAGFVAGAAVLAGSPGGVLAPAGTAATWTVSPGGSATAKTIAGTLTLTDTSTGAVGTCTSSTVTGTVKGGSGLSGHDIGTVTTAAFGRCAALGSVPLTVTASRLPWRISFTSYNPRTHVVLGTVTGVKVALGGICEAVVNGSSGSAADGLVRAVYNDQIGELTFLTGGSNLHYWHVKNCHQLINDGDPVALTASYMVRPIQDITSP
jgi:hypothetical protein